MNSLPLSRVMLIAGIPLVLGACMDPRGNVAPGYSHRILPANTVVPSAADDPQLARRLANNDGLANVRGDVIQTSTALYDGVEVAYWDFGPANPEVAPVWEFRRRDEGGAEALFGHPRLIDSIPGDESYSPIRKVFTVLVTDRYKGEQITTLEALEDAMELGLVNTPTTEEKLIQLPVVRPGVSLSRLRGEPIGTVDTYYRGVRVPTLVVSSATPMADGSGDAKELNARLSRDAVPALDLYQLRRDQEAFPLDEPLAELDLNGDGDTDDSNTIFSVGLDDGGYSGVVQLVQITVTADYEFGAAASVEDLFEPRQVGTVDGEAIEFPYPSALVVHAELTEEVYFLPIAGEVP